MTSSTALRVIRPQKSRGAQADLDHALTLLQGTRRYLADPGDPDAVGPTLRIYRPVPTVSFGQRDARLPGFARATQACHREGFAPLVRRAGGRAAAYHQGSLVVDHISPDPDPIRGAQRRFEEFADLFAQALAASGVSARVGPIPGEYCYGEHSVHGVSGDAPDIRIKLVGTAQRQIQTGWLFSSSVVIEEGAPIRRVLSQTYEHLGIAWDPLTAGAADQLAESVTVDTVESAILESYSQHWDLIG